MQVGSTAAVTLAIVACIVSAAAGTRAWQRASTDLDVPVVLWCLAPDSAACASTTVDAAAAVFAAGGTGLALKLIEIVQLPAPDAPDAPGRRVADCVALQDMVLAQPEGALHRAGTLNVYVAEIEHVLGRACDADSILLHARPGAVTLAHELGHVFGLEHVARTDRGDCGANLMCTNAFGGEIDALQVLRIRQSCQYRRLRAAADGARALPSCAGNLTASVRVGG
jgi:hypothetical protein